MDILNTYANTISYGDAITITVAVTSNEQHVYSITDEAFDSIDEHILDYNSQISTSDDSTTQNNTETQNK